jgi:cell division transport system ATP-binding protein
MVLMHNSQTVERSLGTQNKSQNSGTGRTLGRDIVTLESVTVDYGGHQALHNVNFSVRQGEIVFVTGVSGAGKTTLLNVIRGGIAPTRGKVTRNLKKDALIAPIFQNLYLNQNLTIEKNLYTSYDRNIYKSEQEFRDDMNDFSKILGIRDRLNLKVVDANGGLKQKAAFLRAMLSRPTMILADEPTASLDYDNAKKMFEILNLYNVKQGLTVVWASHNKDLVKRFSGRITHLDQGKLIYSGHACFI